MIELGKRSFQPQRILHRYTALTTFATFLLLVAGGLVTSTDSGLAVPDWPLSYGELFPRMVGGILYEHSHRMIAAVVGLMIAILAGWLWLKEPRRWVRWLGYGALVAVIAQAVLGGITVLWMLPAPLSVAHACLGQTVFCLVVCLALVTSPSWQTREPLVDDEQLPSLRGSCGTITFLLFLQLLLGAMLRHSGHALVPHLIGAVVVSVMAGRLLWCFRRAPRRDPTLLRIAAGIATGLAVQLVLGLLTLSSRDQVVITTAHVAVGSLVLASSCTLSLMVSHPGAMALAIQRRVVAQELVA